MSAYLVNKIVPPRLDRTLDRPRLFKLLEEKSKRSAIWLSGPAGSGKSSLMASFINQQKITCMWYQCGSEDSDPANFFFYLSAAAEHSNCLPVGGLPLLTPEYRQGIERFTLRYFEKLYSVLTETSFIIFDNFQDLLGDTPVPELLYKIIKYTPPHITIAFISRFEPPSTFIRFRLNGLADSIGWQDVTFTKKECKAFCKMLTGCELDTKTVDSIYRSTKGWAAGIVLFMASQEGWSNAPILSETLAATVIFDYFASELLKQIDSQTTAFLLRSSMIAEMNQDTLSRLLPGVPCETILNNLHHRNFFIERRPGVQTTYQYHPLFRNFLNKQAAKQLSKAELADLQCRAGDICADSGQLEEAATLYKSANAWDSLSAFIQMHALALFITGRHQTLSKWLYSLPNERVEQEPWLCFWKGVCQLHMDPLLGRRSCQTAFNGFRANKDEFGQQLSFSAAVESFFLARSDMAGLDAWIQAGRQLKIDWDQPFNIPVTGRFAAAMLGALTLRNPGHPSISRWIDRCHELLRLTTEIEMVFLFANFLVLIHCWRGEVTQAGALIDRLRPKLATLDVPPLSRLLFSIMQCVYFLATGESGRIQTEVKAALKFAGQTGVRVFDGLLPSYGAYAALATCDALIAAKYLEMMAAKVAPDAVIDIAHYHALRAWESLAKGDLSAALTQVETALDMGIKSGAPIATIISGHLLRVKILIAQKNVEQAGRLMDETLGNSKKNGCLLMDFHEQMTLAHLKFTTSQDKEGLEALRRAFERSRIMGILDGNWWIRADLAELCRRAFDAGIEVEQVRRYIQRNQLPPPHLATAGPTWPWPVRIHLLGDFSLFCNDQPLSPSSKSPRKLLELLQLIAFSGPSGIRRETAADILWPEKEGDRSLQSLDTTVHRLRRLLEQERAILSQGGVLRLISEYCWVDAWAFEPLCLQALKKPLEKRSAGLLKQALDYWKGPIAGIDENSFAISYRERVNKQMVAATIRLAAIEEACGNAEKAVSIYHRGLVLDDTAEPLYRELIKLFYRIGQAADAADVFRRCKATLLAKTGMPPQPKTEALLKET